MAIITFELWGKNDKYRLLVVKDDEQRPSTASLHVIYGALQVNTATTVADLVSTYGLNTAAQMCGLPGGEIVKRELTEGDATAEVLRFRRRCTAAGFTRQQG